MEPPDLPGLTPLESSLDGAGTWHGRIRVEPASPFFDGHFEGRPLLPGIAQLALIVEVLGRISAGRARVSEVRSLQLRRFVRPGDVLDVEIQAADTGGLVHFQTQLEERIAASGLLVLTPASRG
jgi:3-hydroxymyristoyl/3-hydroxydecanoyl-(acyl carrier protein) dehydratase